MKKSEKAADRRFSVMMQEYISQVLSRAKLSRKEEADLFKKWRATKSPAVRDTIITANLRYVVAIALGYRAYPVSFDDLISEGNLGLMIAYDKYRSSRKTRFITYAAFWIRAFMLNLIIRSWHNGRTGAGPYRSKVFFKIRREKARSMCLYGNCPEAYDDLARKMEMPVDRVRSMTSVLEMPDLSIDSPGKRGGETSLKDFLMDAGPTPEESFSTGERATGIKDAVQRAMGELDHREKYIIEKRVFEDEGASLAEIGRDLGVSRERARQLEGRAKRKLRSSLEGSGYAGMGTFS